MALLQQASRAVAVTETAAASPSSLLEKRSKEAVVAGSVRTRLLNSGRLRQSSCCKRNESRGGPRWSFGRAEGGRRRPRCMATSTNGAAPTATQEAVSAGARVAQVERNTKETQVTVRVNLDGTGVCDAQTGIPFLDHMLDQLASHGLFDVFVKADGDLHIDDHHTNEDVALALGTALAQALGDRKGIHRFGDFCAPLDEALVHVVLDLSGRPHLTYGLDIPTARVGTYDTQLVEHFFQSLANNSGMTLHVRQLAGKNSHHIIEASFKAFARALRRATEVDPRRGSSVPSSKGVLSRT